MSSLAAALRVWWQPLAEVARAFSLRTRLIIFFGPIYFGLAFRYLNITTIGAVLALTPLALVVVLSFVRDKGVGKYPTSFLVFATLAWAVMLLAINIVNVPKSLYHDEPLLTEAALDGVARGQNPYTMNFRGTIVDTWGGHGNQAGYIRGLYPGWDHYVYLPGILVSSLPVYALVKPLTGWYDQRLVYALAYIALMTVGWQALKKSPIREPLMLAFFLSPSFSALFIGFNDVVMVVFLLWAVMMLSTPWLYAATGLYAFALLSKQSAIFSLPFLIPIFFARAKSLKINAIKLVVVFLAVAMVLVGPFALRSFSGFFDDTVKFFFTASYPITGEGFSRLLLLLGVVRRDDNYPFWIFQLAAVLPTLVIALRQLRRSWTPPRALLATAATVAVASFFSRYFHPSHAHAIILLATGAYLVGEAERSRASV